MIKRACLLISLCALLGVFSSCEKENTDIPDVSSFFGRFNGFIGSISTQKPEYGVANYNATNVPDAGNVSKGTYTSILSSKDFSIGITKTTLIFKGSGSPSATELLAFFTPGKVPLIDTASTSPNGIIVSYLDKSGASWNSATGDQSGGVFTITRAQSSGNDVKIQAEFNCKLYDGAGNTVTLTGGMFTGVFKGQ